MNTWTWIFMFNGTHEFLSISCSNRNETKSFVECIHQVQSRQYDSNIWTWNKPFMKKKTGHFWRITWRKKQTTHRLQVNFFEHRKWNDEQQEMSTGWWKTRIRSIRVCRTSLIGNEMIQLLTICLYNSIKINIRAQRMFITGMYYNNINENNYQR
jgi:hypothetical protein